MKRSSLALWRIVGFYRAARWSCSQFLWERPSVHRRSGPVGFQHYGSGLQSAFLCCGCARYSSWSLDLNKSDSLGQILRWITITNHPNEAPVSCMSHFLQPVRISPLYFPIKTFLFPEEVCSSAAQANVESCSAFSFSAKDKCDHAVSVKHARVPRTNQALVWRHPGWVLVFLRFANAQQEINPSWGSALLAAPNEQVGRTGA